MITEGEKIFNFEIKVNLKEGILDPQGNATLKVLKRLNFPVEEIRFGKRVNLKIKEDSFEKAKQKAEQIAYEVLTNPVLEDYEIIELDEE